jgi:hypothetical protein
MKRYLLLFILPLFCVSGYTKSELNIVNPIGGWKSQEGKISDVILAAKPQGIYMRYDLYLTFSVNPHAYAPEDSLEVEFFFNLPKEAIICDSWLWIEDYISLGIIMDADSASKTYEGIVNRRTDPSILFKRSKTRYELRIFPITTIDPRKVKITYLLPMDWASEKVLSTLPIKELRDWLEIPQVDLILLEDSVWQNPVIMEYPDFSFHSKSDSFFGNYLKTQIDGVATENNLSLGFDSPMQDGIYVSYVPSQFDEGFYQMALLPSEKPQAQPLPPGKILFLIDYDQNNGEDFRSQIRDNIKQILGPNDSFNVMLKTIHGIDWSGKNWVSAHPSTVNVLLSENTFSLSPHSNLFELIKSGYEYINEKNDGGVIVLLSNSDAYHSYASADSFYTALSNQVNISTPMMIANYQHRNAEFTGYSDDGKWGNDHLFELLATNSGGKYYSSHKSLMSIYSIIRQSIIAAISEFETMDVYLNTSISNGFCDDIHSIYPNPEVKSLRSPILQTGKYYGGLPFEAELLLLSGQGFQIVDFVVDQSEMKPIGPSAKKIWTGKEIIAREEFHFSAQRRQEIMDLSIENRILSLYTAFLCLEDSVQFGLIKSEDTGWVGVEPLEETALKVQVYPNPFVEEIHINLKNINKPQQVVLKLIDFQGRVLRETNVDQIEIVGGELKFTWNGAGLPAGAYIILFSQGEEKQFVRLVKS